MRPRKRSLAIAPLAALLMLATATGASSHHGDSRPYTGGPTDGRSRTTTASAASIEASNFRLVGHNDLGGTGFNADVFAAGNYAYVGVWGVSRSACPANGVKVVDISDPSRPRMVSRLQNPFGTTAEDVVVRQVSTPYFKGTLAVVGIQPCGELESRESRGLQFFNVTKPRRPQELGFWHAPDGTIGCHEVDLVVQSGSGKVLAGCANAFAEAINGTDEVVIVDATNPRLPSAVGGFAIGEDLGLPFGFGAGFGEFPASFAHSVRFFDRGHTLYASYWDAGTIRLNITNTSFPQVVSRTVLTPDEDGDNHSMELGAGGKLLLINPEDFSPLFDPNFNGWGELYIYDNRDPSNPRFLSTFATPNSQTMRTDGDYSVHNTEVVKGDQAFSSWYSDGIRWIDLSSPRNPVERGFFVPPPVPDPFGVLPTAAEVWGVFPHNGKNLILASDMNSGLWIIEPVGLGDF